MSNHLVHLESCCANPDPYPYTWRERDADVCNCGLAEIVAGLRGSLMAEWPQYRDDGETLNRWHEYDEDPETTCCVICGWSEAVHTEAPGCAAIAKAEGR